MREVPTGATPASFTAAQPPKCHAGRLNHFDFVSCPFPWSRLTAVRLFLPLFVLLKHFCILERADADDTYAAHAGILDAAKAIVLDLQETVRL